MKINFKSVKIFLISLVLCLGFASIGFASQIEDGLNSTATTAKINQTVSVYNYTSILIKAVLGTMGIAVLILILYAGGLYLTAMGNTEKIKKANGLLLSAVLGVMLVFGAYAISRYVIEKLASTTLN